MNVLSKFMRVVKTWACRSPVCHFRSFDNLGSLVEHYYCFHEIRDFDLMPKVIGLSEKRVHFKQKSHFNEESVNKMTILDDDLSEIIEYYNRVKKNSLSSMKEFQNSFFMPDEKPKEPEKAFKMRTMNSFQNLCQPSVSNLCQSGSLPRGDPNNRKCVPVSMEELKVDCEFIEKETFDAASEESRLTVDRMACSVMNKTTPRKSILMFTHSADQLDQLTLEKRPRKDSEDDEYKITANKTNEKLVLGISNAPKCAHERFKNRISIGNLVNK
jgi:hypothetical protein